MAEVGSQYIDTAYTLGASRRQVILKVLVPLAMPSIFNSLRLLFGLAFGYIMLAEPIKLGGESGRPGRHHQHVAAPRTARAHPAHADDHPDGGPGDRPGAVLGPAELFPYRYGGAGCSTRLLRSLARLGRSQVCCSGGRPPRPTVAAPQARNPSGKHVMSQAAAESVPSPPPPSQPVGMGAGPRPACATPDEVRQPHVVEFRSVTKTYNAGQPNAFTAIRDVTFVVEDLPARANSSASWGPAAAARAPSCG